MRAGGGAGGAADGGQWRGQAGEDGVPSDLVKRESWEKSKTLSERNDRNEQRSCAKVTL